MMYKFTICMPTYNRAYIIKKPLNSLLAQTLDNFEVIVVDDGSSDDTEVVVKQFEEKLNLKYIKKENGGKHTALNAGVKNAKGELFLILDSDDELTPSALQQMSEIWDSYENKKEICGVMGRCSTNGEIIGKSFNPMQKLISYVEFHYGKGGGRYGDCCECVRTDIINKYHWPETLDTRFVPESYVNDMIGLKYKFIVTDVVFEYKEYQENGITQNYKEYIKKNIVGYLYAAVSKINDVLPYAKPEEITFKSKVDIWRKYWDLVFIDKCGKGSRVNGITFWGYLGYIYSILRRLVKNRII